MRNLGPMVITFDRHPREVVHTDYVPMLLTTLEEKTQLLRQQGIENIHVLHFTREMSLLSARDFMHDILHKELGVEVLVMGYDHRFGHDGGTHEDYVRWGQETGIEVILAHELEDTRASSSVCRRLLADGRADEAAKILGHPYTLSGTVVEGHQIGRTLGFPTANLKVATNKIIPAPGVYAVWSTLQDGTRWAGMLNIGHRPTLDNGDDTSIEVCLLDFAGNLYGQTVTLEFVARLREETLFADLDSLKLQIEHDEEDVRRILLS